MIRRFTEYAALALTVALPLAACEDNGPETGRMDVLLTDAPGDVQSAVVVIGSVYLQGESDASDRVFLVGDASSSANIEADLVELENDVQALVENVEVPVGTFAQLRVVVNDACLVVEQSGGGTKVFSTRSGFTACGTVQGELRCPSCSTSGFKVNLPEGGVRVTSGDQALLIDFDVSESFRAEAGASGAFIMQPLIKATRAELTGEALITLRLGSGVSLAGASLGQFEVELTGSDDDSEELLLTDANADGIFEATFRFLAPGTYAVRFDAPTSISAFTTSPAVPATITVVSEQRATLDFTLTGASS